MAIAFNNIPGSGLTAPIFTFEVNSGGQYAATTRFILIGHTTSAGSMVPNTPTPVADQNTVDQLCGPGSMLREMFRIAAMNAPAQPFWIVGVPDAGVAAQWTLTLASVPAGGVGTVVIAGETLQIPVGATDTVTTVAAAIAAAVNAYFNQLSAAMLPSRPAPAPAW